MLNARMFISIVLCCLVAVDVIQAVIINGKDCKMLDMTFELADDTIVYPLPLHKNNRFKSKDINKGMVHSRKAYDPFFVYMGTFSMVEHQGTHVDAPQHVNRDAEHFNELHSIDQVPLESLSGEACVIDIPAEHKDNVDYSLTVEDLQAWERVHGRFHRRCIIIIRTGREVHGYDADKYFGIVGEPEYSETGWLVNAHWPGLSPQGATWLLKHRDLRAIATDATSPDNGNLIDYKYSVHTEILGSNRLLFESLTNVAKLPNRGATVFAMPLKLKGKSGSPARIFAIGWDGDNDPCRLITDHEAVKTVNAEL